MMPFRDWTENDDSPSFDTDLKCPIHNTDLYYWKQGQKYACQDSQCVYSGGIDLTGGGFVDYGE